MKRTKDKAKKRLLDNKRVVLVLSFIVAVLAWIIVGGWINPNDTQTIDNVVIDYSRTSANYKNRDLEIVGDVPETATVMVSGDGNVLLELASTDIVVYPDFSAVNDAGTYEVPLRAVRDGSSAFQIDKWTPESITLQFERVIRTAYPLSVQAEGVRAEDGYFKDEAVPSSLQVEVSGPEGEMGVIAGATVIVDVDVTRTSSYTASDAEVVLLDKNGDIYQPSELVTINPSMVTVDIPILPEKELALSVSLVGAPAGFDYDWFEGLLTLTRSSITVAGEPAILDMMDELSVGNIDVSTFTIGSTYESFNIVLPEGLKNRSGLQTVGVTLNPASLAQRTFEIALENITAVGGPDDLEILPADILDENAVYEVTLVGDAEIINSLLVESIAVQIDASTVDINGDEQQTFAVRVSVPRSGKVFATGSYTILCDVREAVEEDDSDASGS